MPPRRQSAHAELDELRQQAAAERVKARDVEAQLEAAKAKVEQASASIADGYAAEDQRAVTIARKAEQAAVAQVYELQHRIDGAALRVQRAQQQLDEFAHEHARDLLAEREQPARTVAAELTASVRETLRLAKAYVAERQAQDQLVVAVPGASPRADGPDGSHPWEPALDQLARAYQQTPELEPPLPRWQGLEHRTAQDSSARRLQLQRRKRLTADEQTELDTINRALGVSAPKVEVA
jgi:hypothetical protein